VSKKSLAVRLFVFCTATLSSISAIAITAGTLADYYLYLRIPGVLGYSPNSIVTQYPPAIKNVGGGVNPRADTTSAGSFFSIDRFVQLTANALEPNVVLFSWARAQKGACSGDTNIPATVRAGSEIRKQNGWLAYEYGPDLGGYNVDILKDTGICRNFIGTPILTWTTSDVNKFGAPLRRKTIDGGAYDASPMTIERSGVPWITYYWGYRMGLVASESNWSDANLPKVPELANFPQLPNSRDNFEVESLPPPIVEDDVIEYVNKFDFPRQPGGQYFYASAKTDPIALDKIGSWLRTGRSFKSGGYVSACRFYGGINGGPNTHFYSADDKECELLKTFPALSYEGQTFAVNLPMPGAAVNGVKPCPMSSKPLYRAYNNASASGGRFVSNHRYLTERADVAAAVADGWVDEGQVMCVPQ
jgi:hypothetical protein